MNTLLDILLNSKPHDQQFKENTMNKEKLVNKYFIGIRFCNDYSNYFIYGKIIERLDTHCLCYIKKTKELKLFSLESMEDLTIYNTMKEMTDVLVAKEEHKRFLIEKESKNKKTWRTLWH